MKQRKWLTRSTEIKKLNGDRKTMHTLSILEFTIIQEEEMNEGELLVEFNLKPYVRELPGIETIDFKPILEEITPGKFKLMVPKEYRYTLQNG